MPDVFGRTDAGNAGVFMSEGGSTSVSTGAPGAAGAAAADDLLLQNIQVTYQRPINFVFGLGTTKRYMVIGRSQGSFSIGRIVGPAKANANFLSAMADPCVSPNGADVTIKMGGGSCPAPAAGAAGPGVMNTVSLTLGGAFLTSVGYAIQAQDVMINENLQGMCTTVEVA